MRRALPAKAEQLDGGSILFEEAEQHIGCAQCGMTAQVDLTTGCEPSQVVIFAFFYSESSFGQVVFDGDLQHQFIGRVFVQHTNCSRIAFEYFFSKCVNMITFHGNDLLICKW